MTDSDARWFHSNPCMPHGHCYSWTPGVLWMHVVSDILIAMACFAIPFVLLHIARRRRDVPFRNLFTCFSLFIVACGLAHAMAAWNVWHTAYWLEGAMKVLTAAASVPTALLLWRALPGVLSLPSHKQLREANESLARANRELEAFTASVSHDLRSPLTGIAGQAGLLELSLGAQVTDEQKRRLLRIENSVRQMSELIDALLVLSRISRHTLRREIVDISALAEQVVADLRQKEPARNVHVAIQPNMAVHGDRRLLNDMLANLIANAWKFTSKTTAAHIEIGQKTSGSMATLYIRDNGAGFNMAYEQKLFKPFQRLHGAEEFEGTGIGLATVARIIERHGGRIWAESKVQQGAIFYFTLPTLPITEAMMLGREVLA